MIELYNLGKIPWHESQLIYHALARLGREALSLVSPAAPYVCIGFHQDAEQEVDLEFCRKKGLPVFRREVGGGAVYLDGEQLFFQLVLHADNPIVPRKKEAFYRKFLQAPIQTYRRIGIPAEYKPINDILSGNRKISGTGVGEIADSIVFVGNLIVDFDYEMMSKVLRVPDEKFRDKVHRSLVENVSTIRRELGKGRSEEWDEHRLNSLLAGEFEKILGPMMPKAIDAALRAEMDELAGRMLTHGWLHQNGRRSIEREVKIRSGLNVIHRVHKAPGGLIRADYGITEGRIRGISFSGDFFCFPEEALTRLESSLEGRAVTDVEEVIHAFYEGGRVETPGISACDWVQVLKMS